MNRQNLYNNAVNSFTQLCKHLPCKVFGCIDVMRHVYVMWNDNSNKVFYCFIKESIQSYNWIFKFTAATKSYSK